MEQKVYKTRLQRAEEKEHRKKNLRKKLEPIIKISLAILLILVVLVSCSIKNTPKKSDAVPSVCFKNGGCLEVIPAKTNTEQEIGLSNYSSLNNNQSMLFIFPKIGNHKIWMANMSFYIDIIWIDRFDRILAIQESAEPCIPPDCIVYDKATNAKYILETPVGFVKEYNLFVGDRAEFQNLP